MASSGDNGERAASLGEITHSSRDAQRPAGAPPARVEMVPEVEPWAASVPPVSSHVQWNYGVESNQSVSIHAEYV